MTLPELLEYKEYIDSMEAIDTATNKDHEEKMKALDKGSR